MRRVNLTNPETELDPRDPPGYQAEMFRFGKDLGAQDTGASLDVLFFPKGPDGAHEIRNDSDAP